MIHHERGDAGIISVKKLNKSPLHSGSPFGPTHATDHVYSGICAQCQGPQLMVCILIFPFHSLLIFSFFLHYKLTLQHSVGGKFCKFPML